MGHSWVKNAFSGAAAGQIGYKEFSSELEASMHQEQEERAGRLLDQTTNSSLIQEHYHIPLPAALCTGQSRYGKPINRYAEWFNNDHGRPQRDWSVSIATRMVILSTDVQTARTLSMM